MPLEEKGMAVRLVEVLPSAVGLMGGVTGLIGITGMPPVMGSQFTAGYLISGKSGTGSGNIMDSRGYDRGALWLSISGNSASASLLVSHDSATWEPVWSAYTGQYTAFCNNWAQIEEYYPYFMGRVEFASASGGVTATVSMHMTRKG